MNSHIVKGMLVNFQKMLSCNSHTFPRLETGAMNGKLVSWLNYSMDCSHEELACSCLNFIAWNFELMANQDRDFALIDIRTMMDLLARDDLVVRDELTLFTCVSRWLFAQEKRMRRPGCSLTPSEASSDRRPGCSLTPSEASSDRRRSSPTQFTVDPESVDEVFESLVKEIMTLIRFPMMSPIELANLLIDPLVSRFKGFLVDQMAAAMVYHNLHAPPSCMSHQRSSPVPTSHNLASSNLSIDNPRKKRKHLNSCDDKSLIPRLYTNEKWSASLITDNYSSVPAYGTRTLMFQTPATLFQDDKNSSYPRRGSSPSFTTSPTPSSNPNSTFNTYQTPTYQQTPSSHYNEWAIDLHPKGLWFKAFKLIVWHGTLDCPEVVIKSVRLSVTSIHARNEKVKIGILVFGRQEGVDFVKQITTTVHTFTGEQNMININDLIPYESLNVPLSDQLIYRPRSSQVTMSNKSGFLIGPRNDTFKIHVVITPLTNY